MTRAVWLWIALMAGAPSAVAAQVVGGATGTIAGTVTDATSAALAGASVTVTGPAIMRPRTVVTDARGHYQIVALPPGDYAIEFRHTGFRTATRTGVVVGVDFTAGVDAELDVGPIETAVAVSARPPVVDPSLTSLSFSFDPQMLASLPGARSMGSLLAAAPGVFLTRFDVGGNASPPGVYGALGINSLNRPTVEGINVSGIAPTGFALDFGSFDTVWVGTGAHTAEWYSPGVHMQFVIKSGGNRYAGTIYADYEPRDWQSVNIDAAQIARGAAGGAALPPAEANRVWSDRDLDADIGGYVRRDRLWWYASVRDQDAAIRAVNFPIVPLRTQITSYGGKLTWSLRPSQRAVLYGQGGRNHQPYRLDAFAIGGVGAATAIHESVESTSEQVARGRVWKAEWNAAIGSRFYVDARIGEFDADRPERPRGQAPRFEDIGTQIVCGGSRDLVQSLNRTQANGSINVLADDGPGRHHVKVGWEISQTMATDDWAAASPGDVLHVLRNARPTEVVLFESPSRSQTGQRSYALFVSDGWQITDRLTLHLGGRLDRHRLFLPAQAHGPARFNPMREVFAPVDAVIDWNLFVPRLSAAFDVTGDGRTIAKLSVNQYHTGPGVELAAAVNPNAAPWWRRYAWSDPNRNGVWDAGEEGTELARRGGLSTERLDPALELPRLTEIAASVERDVGHGLALRA
ncbi:MAG TPA: TonB-dependent receptor, partial [Vicinamibacterales bacterium]|nr:TonB-dependent receptor [Vicinamibacterales bacterium]